MAKFKVIASPDFEEGGSITLGSVIVTSKTERRKALFGTTTPVTYAYRPEDETATVELETEDSVRRFSSAAGWGAVGAVLTGPLGLLLGAIWGGRSRSEVCFSAVMTDGRQFLAIADKKVYHRFLAGARNHESGAG